MKSLVKDSYYLRSIREEIEKGNNTHEILWEIQLILRKWEKA